MNFKRAVFLGWILFSGFSLKAQELESYPASIKWWQINTPHFKIIYPESGAKQAGRIANALEHFYGPASKSLNTSPRKIRVVVNNQTSVSNGFVSMAPRRSEIFTAPPQDHNLVGSNEWIPFVTLHEYRHIVQFQKAKTGFSKLSYMLFGPEAFNAMAVLATPTWFWEGDAVVIETSMSRSGRGRNPEFDIEFRTPLLTNDKPYSYYKQYLGSYRDFIPDHYRIGYFMSTYLRNKYGRQIWDPILKQANAHSFLPFTFSIAMKRNTGKYLLPIFKEMMSEMKSKWQENLVEEEEVEIFSNENRKVFTNYLYPQHLDDTTILVVREGLGNIQQFITMSPSGEEKQIFTPGVLNRSPMISAKKGLIVWTEHVPDIRWSKRTFSSVKIYNNATKLVTRLTINENFASADISYDLTKIVSVYTSEEGKQQIAILQSATGTVIREFPNPDNSFYQHPRFMEDDKSVIVVKLNEEGKSIVLLDVETGIETQLTFPSAENVGYPVQNGEYVFYNSPYNGIDNIYAVEISNGKIFQITEAKFGAYNPHVSPDGEYLYYNLFQANGMDIVRKELDPSSWIPLEVVKDRNIDINGSIVQQEDNPDLLNTIPETQFESKRYRKFSGIFTPVSWGPYLDATTSELFIGVRSRDVLSNIAWDAGYIYNNTEGTESWRGGFSYQGIYTPINSSIIYGKRYETVVYLDLADTLNPNKITELSWYETEVETGLSLPLNLTNGRNFTGLTFENSVSYIHKEGYQNPNENPDNFLIFPVSQGNGNIISNNFSIFFSRLWRRSKRDINSKFGQYFIFRTSGTIAGDYTGNITTFRAGLFFPGFFRHHSLFLRGGVQSQKLSLDSDFYRFRNQIEFPRGFGASSFNNYSYGSVTYAMPLLYPDLAVGPVVYIQRIKANLFVDFARGTRESVRIPDRNLALIPFTVDYLSYGAEITFDFNLFRLLYPLEMGVRFNFMNDPFGSGQDPFSYEFLIGSFGF
jgi:hypothetical protein